MRIGTWVFERYRGVWRLVSDEGMVGVSTCCESAVYHVYGTIA